MEIKRPVISEYGDPVNFFRDMLDYRRHVDPQFSVHRAAQGLRRVSPTLVSLIAGGKRRITLDRSEELAQLMNLSTAERFYFRNWIENGEEITLDPLPVEPPPPIQRGRKTVSTSLLNDWINVYVKDLFQIPEVRKSPELIYQHLAAVAVPNRIERAFKFLIREGYLRRTMAGQIEVETNLAVADPKVPSHKIRRFHKGALKLAQLAIDLYSPTERMANTLTIPLNEKSYGEFMKLIEEFAEKIKDFAAKNDEEGDRLYQLIVNLSPIGGKTK